MTAIEIWLLTLTLSGVWILNYIVHNPWQEDTYTPLSWDKLQMRHRKWSEYHHQMWPKVNDFGFGIFVLFFGFCFVLFVFI